MPFAALPSSGGFVQPQAPDWGRFAELAIHGIEHGGDIRAQAGKDLVSQLDKSFGQVSKIMEYNSPEERLKRKTDMIKNQALADLYEDFRLHKDKYTMTAHGPMLTDPYQQQLRAAHLREATSAAFLNETRANKEKGRASWNDGINQLRASITPVDVAKLPPTPNQAHTTTSLAPEVPSTRVAGDEDQPDNETEQPPVHSPPDTENPEVPLTTEEEINAENPNVNPDIPGYVKY